MSVFKQLGLEDLVMGTKKKTKMMGVKVTRFVGGYKKKISYISNNQDTDSTVGYRAYRGYGKTGSDHISVQLTDCTRKVTWDFSAGEKDTLNKVEKVLKMMTEVRDLLKNAKTTKVAVKRHSYEYN